MSTSKLIRWGGMALIVAGVLFFVMDVLGELVLWGFGTEVPLSQAAASPVYIYLSLPYFFGAVLLLLGVISLYAHQVEHAGVFGLVAFVLAITGIVMVIGSMFIFTFIPPILVDLAPAFLDSEEGPSGLLSIVFMVSFTLLPLGIVLMSISSLISRAIPRTLAIIAVVATLVGFGLQWVAGDGELFLVASFIGSAAMVALGLGLWRPAALSSTMQSAPARAK